MRIIAGKFGGRKLAALGKGDAKAHLRPTTDRVRESLFSMLDSGRFGAPFEGTRVLDLFAGTGALGLEALSRGAAHVTFVDDGRVSGRLIQSNIAALGCNEHCRLLRRDATLLPPVEEGFDTVFLDPPYGKALGDKALLAAADKGYLAPEALIVWEESTPQTAPAGFELLEHRTYGDTAVSVMRRALG